MSRGFTLYWSNLARYEKCPQLFLWARGWGTIDVGGGPGRKKPKPVKKSEHHAVMGIAIQAVIERMYNDELWKDPKTLTDRLRELLKSELKALYLKHYIDWRNSPSQAEIWEVCENGVLGYLKTMKHNRLLGPYARSEVDLVAWVNKYTPIGGRVDMIIRRDTKDGEVLPGITLLDGKNSVHKDKYLDPDQLRWYALCFYLAYGQMPDRLGWVYYRYPYGDVNTSGDMKPDGTYEIETGVDWVPFNKEDLKGIAQRAVDARKAMDKEKFDPTPSPSACRFCDYETVCDARKQQKAINRSKRIKNTPPDIFDSTEGFTEFGFGSSKGGSKPDGNG
jgi:hypothetical protein